jgi:hypothetical protein
VFYIKVTCTVLIPVSTSALARVRPYRPSLTLSALCCPLQEHCKANNKTEVCRNAAVFADINAGQTARVGAGKKFVDYLITECKYAFPNKTSGCDCVEVRGRE